MRLKVLEVKTQQTEGTQYDESRYNSIYLEVRRALVKFIVNVYNVFGQWLLCSTLTLETLNKLSN